MQPCHPRASASGQRRTAVACRVCVLLRQTRRLALRHCAGIADTHRIRPGCCRIVGPVVVVLLLPLLLLARSLLFHLPGVSSVQLRWRRQGARKKAKKEGQNGRYSHDKNFLEKISAHP